MRHVKEHLLFTLKTVMQSKFKGVFFKIPVGLGFKSRRERFNEKLVMRRAK